MKIGILSMQQVINYGSFLQAFGLKKTIESLGHTVNFINIEPGIQLYQYKGGYISKIKRGIELLNCSNPLKMVYYWLKLRRRFNEEFLKILHLSDDNSKETYDTVVVGSDEVWNFAQKTWFGFSAQLFGENIKADHIISYAACFGATTLPIINDLGLTDKIRKYLLNNFSSISVRDENSLQIVKGLTGNIPIKNIDPVLLYDFKDEIPDSIPHTNTDYMIIYTYTNRLRDKEEVKAIKKYAQSQNLKIIAMADYFDWADEIVTPNPFEVMAYIRDANCIVTDTFHGTVMSIKFNKQFVTFVRESNNNKLSGLLRQFNLENRIVEDITFFEQILNTPIDYTTVNNIISTEKSISKEYLISNI